MYDLMIEFEKTQRAYIEQARDLTRLWYLLVYAEEVEEEHKTKAKIKKYQAMAEAELKKRKATAPKPPRPKF